MRNLYPTYADLSIWLQPVAKLDDKGQRIEFLRQAVAEIGDATVNPLIVGNGRDRSLRGNHAHNCLGQDRGNES